MKSGKKDFMPAMIAIIIVLARFLSFLFLKYPLNIDSYYYLNIAKTKVLTEKTLLAISMSAFGAVWVVVLHMLCMFVMIIAMFCLIKKYSDRRTAIIATLMLGFSPIFTFNTNLGIFDKNIMILFAFIMALYIIDDAISSEKKLIWIFLISILIYYIWQGCLIIFLLIFLYWIKDSKSRLAYVFLFGMSMFVIARYSYYFQNKALIMETRSLFYSGFIEPYLIFFVMGLYAFLYASFNRKQKQLMPIAVTTFLMASVFFRLAVFLLPFAYILMAILMKKYKGYGILSPKTFIFLFYGLSVIGSLWAYSPEPIMNDCIKEAMDYVNIQDTECLAADWGRGHIYQYYTNKTVLFMAHYDFSELDYLAYEGKKHNCSILYDDRDILAVKYMINFTNRTCPDKLYMETLPAKKFCGNISVVI